MRRTRNNRRRGKNGGMAITTKITTLYGSIFAIALTLSSLFILLNANFYYRDLSQKELDQTADKVAEYIQDGGAITEEAIRSLNPNKYVEIRVFNVKERAIVVQFSETTQSEGFPEPPHEDDITFDKDIKTRAFRAPYPRYMFDQRMVTYGDDTYAIQVMRRYAFEHKLLRLFTFLFLGVNALGVVGAFLIGRYISKLMLRPIANIRRTAERISIEDLSRRIPVEGPDDELKELTITFNAMIDRLETSFAKQNQFVSDASHELRTPISVIQGYANLMDRWGKKDEEVLQESIDSIKAETEHMAMLIKKLLFLAKGEQQGGGSGAGHKIALQKMPIYLNSLAAEVVKEMTVMELAGDVEIENLSEGTIFGDHDLIKQMLWIFIENSIKYAKDGDMHITVRIFRKEDKSCISVIDNGIGIGEEDLPLIFERFYRADKSRSNEVPGTGLGLSIASWIIKQHDAVADVKSVSGEGTEMTISFPLYEV